ncbi:SAM-dependent methyltransferase [Coraliomargarita sp. W4R53]
MKDAQTTVEEILRTRCQSGPISYRDYIEIALYSEDCGYYKQQADRVGRSSQHDFYTAESLGRVFATLVTTAAVDLVPSDKASEMTFVEIAAEPGTSLLSHLDKHPFGSEQVIRQGQAIQPAGPVVIFANEWLDALPFHRLIFRDGAWRERGVGLDLEGTLVEVLLDHLTPEVAAVADRLPAHIEDGYELDLPLAAETALADLLDQDWNGLLVFFDYGRIWTSLLQDHPSGTARTYKQHSQGNNLLETPGDCDITCDINWTPLMAQMEAAGLHSVVLESQESFLVKRAQRAMKTIISDNAGGFSSDRQTLMQLIHPANMGQRFQVLWGLRGD